MQDKPKSVQDLNINTTFKIVWAGFLRIEEFTYIKTELINQKMLIVTKLTWFDITFSQDDQHVIF